MPDAMALMVVHKRWAQAHAIFAAMPAPALPPRVSVVLTLYNKGPFVAEAVRSILAQTFADFELLVVDDASTDEGPAEVAAIADPRVRFLPSAVNTGRPAAANRGIAAARGEFIAFLDADDLMYPERLAKQVAFLDAHPQVAIVGTCVRELRDEDQIVCWPTTHEEGMARIILGDAYLHPASMVRRTLFADPGVRFDENWRIPGMDYLFQVAVCRRAVFANLPEVLGCYRRGVNNFRSGRDARADRLQIARRVFELLGWPASDQDIDDHVTLTGYLPDGLTVRDIARIRRWRDRLLALNRDHGLFPQELFRQEVMAFWHRHFHRVADQGWCAGLAWWYHSPGRRMAWLTYLAKVQAKRMLHRSGPGHAAPAGEMA
ncbi:MAG: glycosyltransferase family 2 protein [Flavobacteriia bacterium]|nr:glycosyltransferase family 2 protein [Flavobacteriia bacterium]